MIEVVRYLKILLVMPIYPECKFGIDDTSMNIIEVYWKG